MGTFTGSTIADSSSVKAAIQAVETAVETKMNTAGGTFTGNIALAKNWPDVELKSGDEKRLLFSDAGGGSTAAIKHVGTSLDFYAGGIAGGNKEFVVASTGCTVTKQLIVDGIVTAADDTAAAAAGVPVNGLYRVAGAGLVKCRIS